MPVLGNQEFKLLVETAIPIIDPANFSGVRCETESVSGNVIVLHEMIPCPNVQHHVI